jgi:hypothetical protein
MARADVIARCRRLCTAALCAGALVASPAQAEARDERAALQALFAQFAAQGERRADFAEKRVSPLLRVPVVTRGTLYFRPPALLERETTTPRHERVRIDGDVVTVRSEAPDGAVEHTLRLSALPQLAALATTLRATLGGDLAALERLYRVEFKPGAAGAWSLLLTPLDDTLEAAVRRILINGTRAQVDRIEFVEASGDRTELAIAPRR